MKKSEIKQILMEKYQHLLLTPEMVIDIVVDGLELGTQLTRVEIEVTKEEGKWRIKK